MVVGSDISQGQMVRWYAGGVLTVETKTMAAGDVSAGYISLAKKAEYGSVILLKGGVLTACLEKTAAGAAGATESSGTNSISYTSITAGDVLTIQYIDIETTALSQVATCLDVKTSISADTKTAAIHGQANKLKTVGAIEQEADLEEFVYTPDFLSMCLGDTVTGTPAANMQKLTTKLTGVKKIGCLVGKKYNAGYTTVLYKWILLGAQVTGVDKDFPTDDFYKDSMKFMVDEYLEVDLVA